jgi:putative transposase
VRVRQLVFNVHFGLAQQLREMRADVLDTVYAKRPACFVRKAPEPPKLPEAAWINKPDAPRPDDQTIPARG